MSAVAEHPRGVSRRRTRSGGDLVSLAGPVFELLLKLRAGTGPASNPRPVVQQLLKELEERGVTLRYGEPQIREVKFALAAFVDETVMSTNLPLREEWEKFPLQLEYFGEQLAGIKFFEHLEDLLKRIETEADVVEVYYVCLLLGFKGKYQVYMEEQLQGVIENTSTQLKRVGRLQEADLSPHWKVRDQPAPRNDPGLPLWAKIGAGAGLLIVCLIYLVLIVLNKSEVGRAIDQLLF